MAPEPLPPIQVRGIPGGGVQVLDFRSPDFDRLIGAWLDADTQALAGPLLPYSIILRNGSQRPIACVTAIWKLRNEQGIPITHTRSCYNFFMDLGTFIQPGETLFMGPASGMTRRVVTGGQCAAGVGGSWADVALFANQERVVIALDSVTFDDGTIIGPDEAGNMLRINEMMRADDDLAAEVSKLDDSSAENLLRSARDGETAYDSRRAQFASNLSMVIAHEGMSRAREILRATAESRKIPTVHRN